MSLDLKNTDALIASRICHDLAGPISAISNGIELLQLTGADPTSGPEIDLVNDSIANLTERLRLCRIAFGAASTEQQIGISELQKNLQTLYQSRVSVHWRTDETMLTRYTAKFLILSVLCVETTIPHGGEITISGTANQWDIAAQGESINPPNVWNMLTGATADPTISPSQCQFFVLPQSIAEGGAELSADVDEKQSSIRLKIT